MVVVLRRLAKARPPSQRANVTNDIYRLPGVDMRSAGGRRYTDIVHAIVDKFGGGDTQAIRDLAGLRFTLEAAQAAVVMGESKARDDIVRLSRLIEKKESALRLAAATAPLKNIDDV